MGPIELCVIGVLLLLVGAVVFRIGRRLERTRRSGNVPHCGVCEYALTGLPPETKRCPECGSFLDRSRVIGQRQRSDSSIFLTRVITAGLLVFGVFAFYRGVTTAPWQQWYMAAQPTDWLLNDLSEFGTPSHDRAADELYRRFQTPDINDAKRKEIAQRLTEIVVLAPTHARPGTSMQTWLQSGSLRTAVPSIVMFPTTLDIPDNYRLLSTRRIYWEEPPELVNSHWIFGQNVNVGSGGGGASGHKVSIPSNAKSGLHELVVEHYFIVVPSSDRVYMELSTLDLEGMQKYDVSWIDVQRIPVEVVGPDDEFVTGLVNGELREQLVGKVRVTGPSRNTLRTDELPIARVFSKRDGPEIAIDLVVDKSPISIIGTVSLRRPDGVELAIGEVRYVVGRNGTLSSGITGYPDVAKLLLTGLGDDHSVDVIIGPNKALAEATPGVTTYWNEPIVIPNVELQPDRGFKWGPGIDPDAPADAAILVPVE